MAFSEWTDPPDPGESVDRLRETFTRSTDVVLVLEAEGRRIVDCNVRARRAFDEIELLGADPAELYDADGVEALIDDALAEGAARVDSLGRHTACGERMTVEASAASVETDERTYVILAAREWEAERHRRQGDRYERMFETVGVGAFEVDDDLGFLVVTDGLATLTGYSRGDLETMRLPQLLVGEVDGVAREEYGELSRGEGGLVVDERTARDAIDRLAASDSDVLRFECPIYTDDGSVLPCELRLSACGAEDGTDRGCTVGVLTDTSAKKRRERQLEALNEASRGFSRFDGVDEIAAAALDAVDRILGFEVGCVRLFDADRNALEAVATSDGADRLIESTPAYDLDATLAGRAFRSDQVVESPPADDRRSGANGVGPSVHVPIDGEGVLSIVAEGEEGFERWDLHLAELLAAALGAEVGRANRERSIHERERTVREQRDQLDVLNRINTLVQDLVQELIDAGCRADIEERVCTRLAGSEIYESAWIAEVGATEREIRTNVGVGIDDEHLAAFERIPVGRIEDGAVLEAIESREASVVRRYREDDRGSTDGDGSLETVTAVPLRYGDRVYGVLVVSAAGDEFVNGSVTRGLEVLGETIGFAIDAVQNRELLLSDHVVRLEFQVTDRGCLAVAVSDELACRCTVERDLLADEGTYLTYLRVEEANPEESVSAVERFDTVERCRVVSEGEEDCLLEVTRTASGTDAMMGFGATVREATAECGVGELVVETPRTANVREVVAAYSELNPESTLVSKQELERPIETINEFREGLDGVLTDRQRTSLETAYYSGYYDWPRKSTAEEVASSLGIASATFHQHVRKAEGKLLSAFLERRGRAVG